MRCTCQRVIDEAATDRERVADYVRRALPRELAERGIDWAHSLEHDAESIRPTLTRGDLVLTHAATLGGAPDDARAHGDEGRWWTPVTKRWAQELTWRLVHILWFRVLPLRDVDETGRLHVLVWKAGDRYLASPGADAEAIGLVLEPGFIVERAPAGSWAYVRRVTEPDGATVADALELGWARVEG
jgi:hypothetical protein